MARIAKTGLDYFPFDIDFFQDIRIRKLIRRQGGKAITVYALLLCYIYKNGYFLRWDNELPFIFSELSGYDEAYVSEAIKACLSLGLLDKAMFEQSGVLTSRAIQTRYCNAQRSLKRVARMEEFLLIEPPRPRPRPKAKAKRQKAKAQAADRTPPDSPAPQSPAPPEEDARSNAARLNAFLSEENAPNLDSLCKNLGMGPGPEGLAALRLACDEVIAEWELSQTQHRDYSDWSRHLISTLRIKARREPSKAQPAPPAPDDYGFDGGFGSSDK